MKKITLASDVKSLYKSDVHRTEEMAKLNQRRSLYAATKGKHADELAAVLRDNGEDAYFEASHALDVKYGLVRTA